MGARLKKNFVHIIVKKKIEVSKKMFKIQLKNKPADLSKKYASKHLSTA